MSDQDNILSTPSDEDETSLSKPTLPIQKLRLKPFNIHQLLLTQLLRKVSFFAWLFLFNLPFVAYVIMQQTWSHPWRGLFLTIGGFGRMSLYIVIITYIYQKIRAPSFRKCLRIPIYSYSLFVFIADAVMLAMYGILANDPSLLVLIVISSPREGAEFITTFFSNPLLYVMIVAALLALFMLHWLLMHLLKRPAVMLTIIALSLLSLVVPLSSLPSSNSLVRSVWMHVGAYRELSMIHYLSQHTHPVHVPGVITADASVPVVVVVIGESTSRHHMGVYGYPLPTTPHISSLQQQGRAAVFTDVISPHANTEDVLKDVLTFHNAESPKPWYNYTNIIDVLTTAGYRTTWVANQDTGSLLGSAPRILSSVVDERIDATSTVRERGGDVQDSLVLPHLHAALSAGPSTQPRAIFLHLIGTHYIYRSRYPDEFNKFTASDTTGLTTQQRTIRANYANAILYNDYIVSKVIEAVEDKEAVVVYMSDHAEEVYDDPYRNYAGHDEFSHTHWMAEIPFVIYTSPTFDQAHPDVAANIRASVNQPYSTDDFPHTLLDLLSLRTPLYDATRSVINPSFDSTRPRIFAKTLYHPPH